MFRIGEGYDVHKLTVGRKLILGGIDIPFDKGLLGHSDADCLIHSIIDAILGALALGDIGKFFPDNNLEYKDISSIILLKKVNEIINGENEYGMKGKIVNIDSTIICEKPKLRDYIDEMRNNIAKCLNIDINQVSVKATTEEGLGFTGSSEGIACKSVCLIEVKPFGDV